MTQKQLITMTKTEARRYDVIKNLIAGKIDGSEAAKALNLSVRQIKRIKKKVIKLKIKGVIHGNRGKISHNKTDPKITTQAKKLLKTTYHDFNPLLAQEHLRDDNQIDLSSETVRQLMITDGLWKARKKGQAKPKRSWRERKENYGEMQQFDGSYHNWFEGNNVEEVGLEQCLLLAVDDATGKPTKAEFALNEGVVAVFKFWKEYFEDNGKPVSIYSDRFSTYKVNHKNAVDNKDLMTQYERAMQQLNVRVIHANSPQAKGRVEKMNGTFQRRLVKEMRLAKIKTIAEANIFLKEVFIPKFNKQFAVEPKKPADLHQKLSDKELKELDGIMSIHSERAIQNDYTVRFKNNYFQLAEIQPTTVYKKDRVMIEEWLNGEVKISVKGKYLNYSKLPARPKKEINIKLALISVHKSKGHIPPANHPWKQHYPTPKVANLLLVSV